MTQEDPTMTYIYIILYNFTSPTSMEVPKRLHQFFWCSPATASRVSKQWNSPPLQRWLQGEWRLFRSSRHTSPGGARDSDTVFEQTKRKVQSYPTGRIEK